MIGLGIKPNFADFGTSGTPFSNTKSTVFDGVDDYIDCGGYADLNGLTEMSVSVWIKPTLTTGLYFITHNGRVGGSSNLSQFQMFVYSGFLEFSIYSRSYQVRVNTPFDHIIVNQWNHILVAIDISNNGIIYINGTDRTAIGQNIINVPSGIIPDAADSLYLAESFYGYLSPFLGFIDEFSIFNSDIRADVSDIYNGGVPTDISSASGLNNWWRMGEGATYPTIPDQIGSNNGTMANMTAEDIVEDTP